MTEKPMHLHYVFTIAHCTSFDDTPILQRKKVSVSKLLLVKDLLFVTLMIQTSIRFIVNQAGLIPL